ncbi:hypothetical protein GHT06_015310 [Daphnia sinensis]|uniref:Uncharacterized protein n=1 Tax=Daphnia sinensis TaxID=1820382 RepID=A0AAD5L9D4_9CRUS|nr:hypothetical protein GHT06_015310 [Daphnia sinensis]
MALLLTKAVLRRSTEDTRLIISCLLLSGNSWARRSYLFFTAPYHENEFLLRNRVYNAHNFLLKIR